MFIFVGAYGIASFYGIPLDDDFSNANTMSALENSGHLMGAIAESAETYMNWQGTYTGSFLTYALDTFANFGIMGIRVEYLLTVFLFGGSVAILLYQFTGSFVDSHSNGNYDSSLFTLYRLWFFFP